MLPTGSGTLILVPLTAEGEEAQIRETLQWSVVERCTPNVPYLKGVCPSEFELQQRELEAATKRKAKMDIARARGEGTSTQVVGTSAHGVKASRNGVAPTQPPA